MSWRERREAKQLQLEQHAEQTRIQEELNASEREAALNLQKEARRQAKKMAAETLLQKQKADQQRREWIIEESESQFISHLEDPLKYDLAPLGSSAERSIDGAMSACALSHEESEMYREDFINLLKKYGRPDERVFGVHIAYSLKPNEIKTVRGLVVFLTHGYAVMSGSKQFRVELKSENPLNMQNRELDIALADELVIQVHTVILLGNLRIEENSFRLFEDNYPVPPLYASFFFQHNPKFVAEIEEYYKSGIQERYIEEGYSLVATTHLSGKRPDSRLIRTWRDAELIAAEWMKYWGYSNVSVTNLGSDGGIDVNSSEAVAQVKAEGSASGRPKIQQLHGVAIAEGKIPIFFALAGFTPDAKSYAEKNNILLFSFDLQGEPTPVNAFARNLVMNVE